jgi:polar amino acid transport system substrate-binding protein
MNRRTGALVLAFTLAATPAFTQDQAPLRTGVDPSFPPHAMPKLGGGIEGYQIDLFNEVARRLHRGLIIEPARHAALIPLLLAERYDFIAAPIVVTPDRAEKLLFTQAYGRAEFQFTVRMDASPITDWPDLRGKTVVVVRDTVYDSLARSLAEPHGLNVRPVGSTDEAVRLVATGQAHAFLAGNTVARHTALRNPSLRADWIVPETAAWWAVPFRQDSATLRGQIEDALKCMKMDGTLSRLAEKWFGLKPTPNDPETTILPGHGIPGAPGADPTAPAPDCSA